MTPDDPRIYDWACEPETRCPYCTPLDPRDIELWAAQLRGPQADEQIQRKLSSMNGHIMYEPSQLHRCSPPKEDREVRLPVGTLWECDCGATWRVRDGVKSRGWVNRRDWVLLGRIHAWWLRRHHTGWTYKELDT